jgi:stress response protein SCP2
VYFGRTPKEFIVTHYLQKGENISLAALDHSLSELVIVTEWQTNEIAPPLDIDVSAFLLTENNKVTADSDFIFYNQPRSLDNAVLFKDRRFKISLQQLSPDITRIAFVLSIHEAQHRKHNFSLANNINIKVFNFATKQEIVRYPLADANSEAVIILATLYRHQNVWKFRAIGQNYTKGLAVLAGNFGVAIEYEPMPLAAITPVSNTQKTLDIHPHKNTKFQPSLKKNKSLTPKSRPKPVNAPLADTINIHDTDALTLKAQYKPITHWFKRKDIIVEVNAEAMDTTGFFDEVAVALGDNYAALKTVSNKIKHRQSANKDRAYIELSHYDNKDGEMMKKFCKELYDYSFVARYSYHTQKNLITLHLQSATRIVQFFNGEWLEWYAFMKIVDYCHARQLDFSCTRNMRIDTITGRYEIDIFFLINGTPLFIECKSGEYRQFIDKYCKLRKQLAIDKPYFLFLVADMNDIKTKGLTAMFDITFINVYQLTDYLAKIV